MTLLKESYLCHLLSLLLAAYEDSGLHRLALRLGAWCSWRTGGWWHWRGNTARRPGCTCPP